MWLGFVVEVVEGKRDEATDLRKRRTASFFFRAKNSTYYLCSHDFLIFSNSENAKLVI